MIEGHGLGIVFGWWSTRDGSESTRRLVDLRVSYKVQRSQQARWLSRDALASSSIPRGWNRPTFRPRRQSDAGMMTYSALLPTIDMPN